MRAREREALGSQPNSDLEMTVYFSSQLLTTIQKQSFGSPEHSTEFHQAPRLRLGSTFLPAVGNRAGRLRCATRRKTNADTRVARERHGWLPMMLH